MPPQSPHAGAELVRTTSATPPQQVRTRPRNSPYLAVPLAVAAASLAVGVTARAEQVRWWEVAIAAAVAVVLADLAAARHGLADSDRKQILTGAVLAVGVAVASAISPLNLRTLAGVLAVVAVATVRVAHHPSVGHRRVAEARRIWLDSLAAEFGAVAARVGWSHLRLNGIEDWGHGHTYRVQVPRGYTIDRLKSAEDTLTSALGRRRGEVTVMIDKEWPTVGAIHVRESDPQAALTEDNLNPQITSVADKLLVALYEDGRPFYLRLFDLLVGGLDILIVGTKGAGKSSLIIRILKLLLRVPDVTFIVADGANGRDLGVFADNNCFYRYVTTPRDLLSLVRTLCPLVDERERVMNQKRWRVWRPSKKHPILVLLIEEMKVFALSEYGPQIKTCLEYVSTRNRATGIVIVGATQYPGGSNGKNTFGHEVRKGMENRFQFRMGESGGMGVLGRPLRRRITSQEKGRFQAEAYMEDRQMHAQVIWTSDEERLALAEEWGGKQARPDDEWNLAEQRAHRAPVDLTKKEKPARKPTPPGVIEGECTVQDVTFAVVRELPKKRAPMDWEEAAETYKELLRQAGPVGVQRQDVEAATGWARTKLREEVIAPSLDARWATYQRRGRQHFYVMAKYAAA
jgi:hypothetical protein